MLLLISLYGVSAHCHLYFYTLFAGHRSLGPNPPNNGLFIFLCFATIPGAEWDRLDIHSILINISSAIGWNE